MNIVEKFTKSYDECYFLSKCSENKCFLKDVRKEDFFIIDGDQFKKRNDEKSVDCIIIDLNQNQDGKYRVLLCELTAGSKRISDLQEKFKSSGKIIIETMNNMGEAIYKIDCLLLGKLKQNGKSIGSKALSTPIRINNMKPLYMQLKPCGFSINQLN